MSSRIREHVPNRPDKSSAANANLSSGFQQMRMCIICRKRRSFGQFIGDSDICKKHPQPKGSPNAS